MASQSIGKKFEERVKLDLRRCFPGTFIYRLPDSQSGYAGAGGSNPADFFAYPGECFLMIEAKAHKEKSIPFTAIRQYEKMLEYKGLKLTFPGVVIWFYDHDKVIWVSIDEMEKMVSDGEKSIGLRMLEKNYKKSYSIIELPSKKLRTFMETDYTYLVNKLMEALDG